MTKHRRKPLGMVFPIPKPGDKTRWIPIKEALAMADEKKERFFNEIEQLRKKA